MDALEPGTIVIMVKNEDGTFSPLAMNEDQACVLNAFVSGLSKDEPFIIKDSERYEKARC